MVAHIELLSIFLASVANGCLFMCTDPPIGTISISSSGLSKHDEWLLSVGNGTVPTFYQNN